MRFLKCLSAFLIVFIFICNFECGAVHKNQIIIGTYKVDRGLAYNYVTEALENRFYNIDTSEDYYNESEVGKAIRDFESKSEYNHVYVISKFSLPTTFGGSVFTNDDLIECIDSLEDFIEGKLEESINKLGHVDEFVFHRIIPRCISLKDIVKAFKNIKINNKKYQHIKFGVSTVTLKEINELVSNGLIRYLEVVQNPYWYGSDFLLNTFEMGDNVYDVCKKYGIKYETYRTLGKGRLVKEYNLLPSALVQHSINKGYIPIVKATGREHLEELVREVNGQMDLPLSVDYDENTISLNIQILNEGQLEVINSKQSWYYK